MLTLPIMLLIFNIIFKTSFIFSSRETSLHSLYCNVHKFIVLKHIKMSICYLTCCGTGYCACINDGTDKNSGNSFDNLLYKSSDIYGIIGADIRKNTSKHFLKLYV